MQSIEIACTITNLGVAASWNLILSSFPEAAGALLANNGDHSATIHSDLELERHNRTSFSLNRLWYLSERRFRRDPRGSWRRHWLSQWRG